MRSFLANGLLREVEAIVGGNPIDLGPTAIIIDMGGTRAFSADAITIVIDTSYSTESGERQVLVETFVRSSLEEYWTEVDLDAEIRATMLEDLGAVSADEIEYSHRRWLIVEVITIDQQELDPELDFRLEFQPSGNTMFSSLFGAMFCVLILSVSLGLGMSLTTKRASVPALVTVVALGGLALVIYVLGLPMPIVLGVVLSSVLLVFPVALVSPKQETMQLISKRKGGPHIDCPAWGTTVPVESDVRTMRQECVKCKGTTRGEE